MASRSTICSAFSLAEANDAAGLFLRLGDNAVALRHQLLGLFDFFGDGDAHLVNDVQHFIFIHNDVAGEWYSAGFVEQFFETVDEVQDVHKYLLRIGVIRKSKSRALTILAYY